MKIFYDHLILAIFGYFLVRPQRGFGPLNSVSSLSSVCLLSFSPSPHFSRNPRIRIFWFFCINTSLWDCKKVTFLDFWRKLKIWPFWPIFGPKWPILAKNGLFWHIFGYFSKTAHPILIIFCIKLTDMIRKWKQLVFTVGKL